MRFFKSIAASGLAGLFSVSLAQSPKPQAQEVLQKLASAPYFIANAGQWDPQVLYLCKLPGLWAWITKDGVVYDFFRREPMTDLAGAKHPALSELSPYLRKGHVVGLRFLGAEPPKPEGLLRLAGCHNYFLGNDPARWAVDVPLFREVLLRNLYPGIDVRYSIEEGRLRFDFLVQPHADLARLRFVLTGAAEERIESQGDRITFSTSLGEVSLAELATWQAGQPVQSQFVRTGSAYSFALGSYDPSLPLLIDPIVYSSFIGGNDWDRGHDVLFTPTGELYLTGYTESTNFPTTTGAYQTGDPDGSYLADAFVMKLNPQGNGTSDLMYSTYIGGNNADYGYSLAIDAAGNVYLAGATYSTNFPTTSGAYQTTDPDNSTYLSEGFVLKLRPQNTGASALVYSTYIGGNNHDVCRALALGPSGQVYVVGRTESSNFPSTSGAYQPNDQPGADGFLLQLSLQGNGSSDLVYSTYLGGNDFDDCRDMAIDANGDIYIAGFTGSTNFPTTATSYQPTDLPGEDAFVAKLRPQGNGTADLLYSTYIGGNGADNAHTLALDASGNVYVGGGTSSTNFPTTTGSYQTSLSGAQDAFLAKLSLQGNGASDLRYSTYLGGSGADYGYGLAVDADGHAYVVGSTASANFPTSSCGAPLGDQGGVDLFVAIVAPLGGGSADLLYATYLGGADIEQPGAPGQGIALGLPGQVFVTGRTLSTDFPTTTGAYQPTYPTEPMGGNAFVTLIDASACLPTSELLGAEVASSRRLEVFPSPSQGQFFVRSAELGTIELSDASGRLLRRYELPPEGALPCHEQLPPGIYFIRHKETGAVVRLVVE